MGHQIFYVFIFNFLALRSQSANDVAILLFAYEVADLEEVPVVKNEDETDMLFDFFHCLASLSLRRAHNSNEHVEHNEDERKTSKTVSYSDG